MEACKFDQYLVRVHGSGRLTKRNRQFLRKFDVRPHFFGPESQGHLVQEPVTVPSSSSVPGDYQGFGRHELMVDPPRARVDPSDPTPIPPVPMSPVSPMSPSEVVSTPTPEKISTPGIVSEPAPVITPRRSVRTRKLPQKLNDYCLYE